jgi:hypothetical protein
MHQRNVIPCPMWLLLLAPIPAVLLGAFVMKAHALPNQLVVCVCRRRFIREAGGSPAASPFPLFRQKKGTKEKATRVHRPAKARGSLRYSRAKAAAELALRKRFAIKGKVVAQSSDSPRRNLLRSVRCSATLTGFSCF